MMNRMIIHSRVGADGVLQLAVPVGKEGADQEVTVTIDPASPRVNDAGGVAAVHPVDGRQRD